MTVGSDFNRAAIALDDGKRVVVVHTLSHTTRRGTIVSLVDGTGPYERQGFVLVQWHDSHAVSRITASELRTPRYTIRVIDS